VRAPKHLSHFLAGLFLLSCFLCLDCPLLVSSRAQSKADDAIRILVGKLFDSYQQKDLKKLLSLWSEKSPFLAENKNLLQREFSAYEKIAVKGFDINQSKLDGDKAALRVVAQMALTRANMVKAIERIEKKSRTIELINEGGIWKVRKFLASEEDLAAAIVAAKTEEERRSLIEKESELMTSDLIIALTRIRTSDVAYQRGYQHALAINQFAYKLAVQIGDQRPIANALANTGYIYGWLGAPDRDPELALDYFRKSLKIGEEFGFKDIISYSLSNSAVIYSMLGELSLASEYFEKTLVLARELGNQTMTIQMLNNLGMINRSKGNYAKGLELLLESLKMSETRLESGSDWTGRSRALQNIGATFFVQGNPEHGLVYTQRAVEAAEKGVMLGDAYAHGSMIEAIGFIGVIYLHQGNHTLAMSYLQKCLKLAEHPPNTTAIHIRDYNIPSIKMEIGNVLAAEKKTPQAIESYQEALQLAEKARDKRRVAGSLSSLGKMYLLLGDYREALAVAERAINIAEEAGLYTDIYDALTTTAEAYEKLGQKVEARQVLDRAIELIEQVRVQSAGSELDRQRFFETLMTPYQAMIDLQIDQKRFTEAFSYTQRAKGRTLLELLQKGRGNLDKSASAAEREREQQLNRKIVSLNRQITSEKLKSQADERRLAELEDQLKKARLEFEAFQTTLYAAHPELKVQRGEIRPVSFEDAADLIPDPGTALLDFMVTDENVHLFVLTKDASIKPTLNTYTIKINHKSLAEKVERYRRRMENRDYDFQKLSQELYVLLLNPAQKQLQGKTNLIISPDNVLWDLPFQTLLSPKLRYLIEDAAISYAPSLSVLKEIQLASKKKQAPAKLSLLAFGNPALGTRSKELAKFVKMGAELQPLPEAAAQVRALGRLYGPSLSKVYTGPTAREEVVKEQSARYRILHLATHGILNDASPMYSHVMLSQTPGKNDEDGLLEAWEMMKLDLNADLVVLAACDTARGRAEAGEGVIGMSWALFVAGCPRTVVSQWKVEASSTTALMVEFHKRFKTRYGGRHPAVLTAEAMRQAALKVMKNPEYAHPFYWGGFVVVGDGN
jgi:CHAT domain-containing protein/Tfp pilus assembly protein PilF